MRQMVAERDMVEMRLREQVTALTAHRDSLQEQLQEQMQQMQPAQPGDNGRLVQGREDGLGADVDVEGLKGSSGASGVLMAGDSKTSPPPLRVGRGEGDSLVSGRGGEEAVDPIELKLRQIEDGVDVGVMSMRVRVRMCMRPHPLSLTHSHIRMHARARTHTHTHTAGGGAATAARPSALHAWPGILLFPFAEPCHGSGDVDRDARADQGPIAHARARGAALPRASPRRTQRHASSRRDEANRGRCQRACDSSPRVAIQRFPGPRANCRTRAGRA